MKHTFLPILVALFATTALWAQNNVITYTASAKLTETTSSYSSGLHTNAFNVEKTNHTFAYGIGTITFDGDVTTIGSYAFYKCSGLTSVTIPASVTSIGNYAFYECSGLTSITIPASVTTIKEGAFSGCSGLTSVTIPSSVTTIEEGVFGKCTNLTSIRVEKDNPNYDSRNDCNAIIETATNTLLSSCKNTFIPNSVTAIGEEAFYDYPMQSITIPPSVTHIYPNAFCRSSIKEITLPSSIQYIGDLVFQQTSLTKITCLAETPPTVETAGMGTFYNVSKSIPVYVPASSISAYQSADGWKNFTNYKAYTSEGYALYIKNKNVTSDNCGDILGDGTAYYNHSTKTLWLNGVDITYEGDVIDVYQDIIINCTGQNRIHATSTQYAGEGIVNDVGTTTLTGNGSLYIKSDKYNGISSEYDVTISGGCVVTLESGDLYALYTEDLTIDNAALIAKGNGKYATISGCSKLIMKNGVEIITDHTHDATAHKFLDKEGNEATEDIMLGIPVKVTALSANSEQGSVVGGGKYPKGVAVTLTATPESGYEFAQWNNGSTDNPYTFVVTEDTIFVASFNVPKVTITTSATHGTVVGGGTFTRGTQVTIVAMPDKGYQFKEWSDGDTDNPRTFKATKNLTLEAIFEEITEGIDEVEDSQNSAVTSSKFLQDGKLFIRRGNHIYDAQGKVVVNK